MTKAEIVTRICEKLDGSKEDATYVVDAMFDIIKGRLEQGEDVKISGFGSFVVKTRRSHFSENHPDHPGSPPGYL